MSRPRFADQSAVRAQNLEAVVRLVRERDRCTRRGISEVLGFNKVTVSTLVNELISAGLLEQEDAPGGSGRGRPSTLVGLDRSKHVSIVVEVLPQTLVISTWTLAGERLSTATYPAQPGQAGPGRTLSRIARLLRTLIAGFGAEGRLLAGVQVAVPGMVDKGSGRLIVSGPLSWSEVAVREILAGKLDVDEQLVDVDKFVNLAMMAEWRRTTASDLIYLDEGSAGLGVGAVVAGRMLTGHRGRAGELLGDDLASKFSLHELGLDRLLEPPDNPAAATVVLDAPGRAAVKRLTKTLSTQLASLAALLDPQLIVLGGHFTTLESQIAEPLRRSLAEALAPLSQDHIEIRFGRYGRDAAQAGGAQLVADRTIDRLLHPG
jgi:predicted NBD/HSP70 family sugar kinase